MVSGRVRNQDNDFMMIDLQELNCVQNSAQDFPVEVLNFKIDSYL
jgi:hypothetical protein